MVSASTLDSGGGFVPADQQPTNAAAAAAASTQTKDSFTVQRSGLDVVANKAYAFSFAYVFEDPDNPSQYIQGTRSPNFIINLQTPDLTQPVTNLVVTPGLLSYGVKWDLIDKALPANKWLIDIQIYESLTGAFAGEEYLVWNGNGNSATILTSNTADRWIRVDTRDQDYRKKSVISAKFNTKDPIVVDTTGPANVTSVSAESGIDTSGYLGFNAYASISWPAVTGGGIRGYRIRFTNDNGATYSYVDSPGTGTTYKLTGLAIGSTYQIAVATYDEYNNTSSSYVSGPNVTVTGTPSVSNFITGGPFQFGVGVGGVNTNKGLYFDASNYWYVNATNSARLKVGGATSNYLLWDGSTFAIDGNITARGGTFSGNIFMSTTGASIYSGTIDSSTGNLTGNGFALNSTGLKVANGTKSVTISAATGTITANGGSIGSWNITDTTLSKNNIILDSAGQIQVGSTSAASIYLKSSGDYVMWAGNNTPDANAKFRVGSDGTLYATGARISGDITANSIAFGATYDGTSLSTIKSNAATGATALQPSGTLTGNVSGTVGGVAVATVTAGAGKGNSAVQPGNGITVDATTKAITAIKASSGLPISSGGTRPVVMNDTGLYMRNALGQDTIFLDSSSGSAVFRGTIYAGAGEFTGSVTSSSGTIAGWTLGASSLENSEAGWNGVKAKIFATTSGGYSMQLPGIVYANGFEAKYASTITVGGNSIATSEFRINTPWSPSSDGGVALGSANYKWTRLYASTSTISTSDIRFKTEIEETPLGLSFINMLNPVRYKFIVGGKTIEKTENGDIETERPGVRKHYGLIAQEVKEAIDMSGVDDFGGWVQDDLSDPESKQSLAYEEFISPMIKAIQELSDMVESLQQEVNTLKGI
jgi:hypothetical protein